MGNRCSIQQSEENNSWLEQSPENRLYRLFRYFWATRYNDSLAMMHGNGNGNFQMNDIIYLYNRITGNEKKNLYLTLFYFFSF